MFLKLSVGSVDKVMHFNQVLKHIYPCSSWGFMTFCLKLNIKWATFPFYLSGSEKRFITKNPEGEDRTLVSLLGRIDSSQS